jgi:sugar phosphate isomerase/epimerase
MVTLSRRHFIGAASSLAVAVPELSADPLGLPIGCQVYPVRDMLGKDFEGTLKQLADIGYKNIEMCSPKGYERGGFGPLVKFKASELKDKIHAAGLKCESCHFQTRELKDSIGETITFAKELGLKQMILASFGLRKDASLDDWKRAAADLNKAGEEAHKAGLQIGFHNHDGEFQKLGDALIYDELMKALDPKLVRMQFQVSVISLGYAAADMFAKYPGRYISIHLQDWSPSDKKTCAVGKGVVDWKKLFGAAKKGGVKNYFVELNLEQMKESYAYLHAMKA